MSDTPEFLKDALKFGINLGLDRMNALDELLGNPEKSFPVVHIAGTNGKGSVTAYISTALAASGLKVGMYTSPFLERFSERMRIIDGVEGLNRLKEDDTYGEIPADTLERLSDLVSSKVPEMEKAGLEHPTEFELVTAICYQWFKEENIDVAVLETGLGGRLDSTNVIGNPLVTVITTIGMDHSDRLGSTIDLIAKEKAGIFKTGTPAIVTNPDFMILSEEEKNIVKDVLSSEAKDMDVDLTYIDNNNPNTRYTTNGTMLFAFKDKDYETTLQGDHQALNASVAISTLEKLKETFPSITDESIANGIKETVWKCRAEIVSLEPVIVIDGGHNPQGAASIGRTWNKMLDGTLKNQPLRMVIGVMKDKDIDGILQEYKNNGLNITEAYTVRVDNPRTCEPAELSNLIKLVYNGLVKTNEYEDPMKAVSDAFEKSKEDGLPILITGSLYLLGQIRGYLRGII